MIGIVLAVKAPEVIDLVANLKRVEGITHRGIDGLGLADGFVFGTGAEI